MPFQAGCSSLLNEILQIPRPFDKATGKLVRPSE